MFGVACSVHVHAKASFHLESGHALKSSPAEGSRQRMPGAVYHVAAVLRGRQSRKPEQTI